MELQQWGSVARDRPLERAFQVVCPRRDEGAAGFGGSLHERVEVQCRDPDDVGADPASRGTPSALLDGVVAQRRDGDVEDVELDRLDGLRGDDVRYVHEPAHVDCFDEHVPQIVERAPQLFDVNGVLVHMRSYELPGPRSLDRSSSVSKMIFVRSFDIGRPAGTEAPAPRSTVIFPDASATHSCTHYSCSLGWCRSRMMSATSSGHNVCNMSSCLLTGETPDTRIVHFVEVVNCHHDTRRSRRVTDTGDDPMRMLRPLRQVGLKHTRRASACVGVTRHSFADSPRAPFSLMTCTSPAALPAHAACEQ